MRKMLFRSMFAIGMIGTALLMNSCNKDDQNTPILVEATEVQLNDNTLTMVVGETTALIAVVKPDNTTDKSVSWKSSDPAVVEVADGKLTAKAKGEANITVTTKNGKIAICKVNVSSIKINQQAAQHGYMVLETTRPINQKIALGIEAQDGNQANVWIDLNNDGQIQDDEKVTQFSSIDQSNYTLKSQTIVIYGKVTKLNCQDNYLTVLEVGNNPVLEYLHCSGNQLADLDISKNVLLKNLYSSRNPLKVLDVSNNTALQILYCTDNELTSLDVSKNTVLEVLYCRDNKLTSLNVKNSTPLRKLYCYNNQIKGDNMSTLLRNLPMRSAGSKGEIFIMKVGSATEGNEMPTQEQLQVAKNNNWEVWKLEGNLEILM
ncbi:Ig-like domain-containing protein [Capnocytophaga canimorsus]|uniref:Ig-like domain-containing protein n=1 Tax=Capnocytophaga canimorsus TaxID=28188 RepID=UPI0037D04DBB